jgi:hypothetical protein
VSTTALDRSSSAGSCGREASHSDRTRRGRRR